MCATGLAFFVCVHPSQKVFHLRTVLLTYLLASLKVRPSLIPQKLGQFFQAALPSGPLTDLVRMDGRHGCSTAIIAPDACRLVGWLAGSCDTQQNKPRNTKQAHKNLIFVSKTPSIQICRNMTTDESLCFCVCFHAPVVFSKTKHFCHGGKTSSRTCQQREKTVAHKMTACWLSAVRTFVGKIRRTKSNDVALCYAADQSRWNKAKRNMHLLDPFSFAMGSEKLNESCRTTRR